MFSSDSLHGVGYVDEVDTDPAWTHIREHASFYLMKGLELRHSLLRGK